MTYLGDFDLKREEELVNSIKWFQNILTKDNNSYIKIIVSELSKRLFNKMCEDGLLNYNDAILDIEEAKKEYIRRKQTEEFPKVLFMLSPKINSCFGDEEMYYISKFKNSLIKDGFITIDSDEKDLNYYKSIFYCTIANPESSYIMLPDLEQFKIMCSKANPHMLDIIRYILGVYKIIDDKVIINNPNILPKINNWKLASKVFEEHTSIITKESRYLLKYDYFGNYSFECGFYKAHIDYDYLSNNFKNTKIDTTNLSKEEYDEIDNYAQWNLLTKDTDGNYHINYYTYSLLLYILNGYKDYNIYQCVRFWWNEKNLKDIIDELVVEQMKKMETDPDKAKRVVYFAQEYSRILQNKGHIIHTALDLFKEYIDEVDLFKELLEKREDNLALKRKVNQ